MSIPISSITSAMQVALLGAITANLRAINVTLKDQNINLHFYYETQPSEEEEQLSEVVVTELLTYFFEATIKINRIVLPIREKIPEIGIRIFHRSEPVPPSANQ